MQTALLALTDEFTTDAWTSLGGPVLRELAAEQGLRITAEALVPGDAAALGRTLRDVAAQGCQVILLLGAGSFPEVLAAALAEVPHTVLPGGNGYRLDRALLLVLPAAGDQGGAWVPVLAGVPGN
jgi:molybdopterin biosynthesis enzyme MoaB